MQTHKPEKVIIYCKFIDSQQECKKRFPNVSILSIQSDSSSLNLQDKNVTIEFDKTWDFGLVDQYQFRVYRNGQKEDTTYHYYLDGNVGLENLIKQNNQRKMKQLNYFKTITKTRTKKNYYEQRI